MYSINANYVCYTVCLLATLPCPVQCSRCCCGAEILDFNNPGDPLCLPAEKQQALVKLGQTQTQNHPLHQRCNLSLCFYSLTLSPHDLCLHRRRITRRHAKLIKKTTKRQADKYTERLNKKADGETTNRETHRHSHSCTEIQKY